jgi:hypothetical protein
MYFWVWVMLAIVIAACSFGANHVDPPREINSGIKPDYVVENRYDPDDYEMCTVISQKTLWRENDNAGSLTQKIVDSAVIRVDDHVMPKYHKQYNEYYPVFEGDKVIGTYGGNTELCFDIRKLDEGVHKVLLSFEITSGEKFSYSWSFTK